MQPDLKKTVRRITPALLAFSAYMVFYPTPAEACHKYVSPYTGKTGCGAKRADKKNGLSTTSAGQANNTTTTANTSPTSPEPSGQSGTPSVTSAASGGRLPWPSGLACASPSTAAKFGNWRGNPVDVLGGWANRETWKEMRVYFGGPVRRQFAGKAPIMVIGLPLLTKESKGDFAGCARGKYDIHFRDVAKRLKRYSTTKKIMRLGWEANGTWYPWSINGNYTEYKSCFRRAVDVLRSVDPSIKISWPLNKSVSRSKYQSLVANAYPGNAYVDYIDLSFYDHYPAAKDQRTWDKYFRTELEFFVSFARKNGKKLGIGEWGLSQLNGKGGGDNPLYIRNMYQFFRDNASMIGYEVYFNCGSSNSAWRIYPSKTNPKASAEYRRLW